MSTADVGHRDDYGRGQVEDPERRLQRYAGTPKTWRATDWRCACPVPKREKHREPFQCVSEDDVLMFWLAHPDTTYRALRFVAWLHREFSGPPIPGAGLQVF